MKNIIQKTLRFGLPVVAAMALFAVVHPAFAGYAFNTLSDDCNTTAVANKTTNEGYGSPCLVGTNITVRPGEQFVTRVYFRNTGNTNANNVYVKLNGIDGQTVYGSGTFTGQILVDGTVAKSQSVTVNFPVQTTATLTKIEFITNSRGPVDITSDRSLFGSSGRFVASTIAPTSTDGDYGVIIATYSTSASNPVYECNDGRDNDHDGYVDMEDPGCSSPTDNDEGNGHVGQWQCNDGIDNDGDGYVDMNDPGCSSSTDNDEYNQVTQTYQCNDGIDNDGDGYVDMNDSGCSSWNDDSEYTSSYNNLYVTTDSYSWINQNAGSITLNGHYNSNNNSSADTYFEYRMNGYNNRTVHTGTFYNSSQYFSTSLYSLTEGSYDYRACVNSSSYCGQWVPFTIINNTYYPQNNQPTVQTLPVIQHDYNFATFDGVYNMNNSCSGTTYFEYGTNSSGTGYTTPPVSRSGSGSMPQSVNGLIPSTVYYYHAVLQNCMGTFRGTTLSFVTDATSVISINNPPTVITRTIVNTTNIGGGSAFIRLTIDNGRDTVVRNDQLFYDISWENITKTDLSDLVLDISFPKEFQISSSDKGQIDRDTNTIYVNISSLKGLEKDNMTVRGSINGSSLKDNDPFTARAIMAFENPKNKAQENAIAYDSDTYLASTNVLGASIFGLGFLPGTLAGWLFLILLLVLVILIIRYVTRREQHNHFYTRDDGSVPPVPMAPMGSTTTTTTDVDYTPYRPTPKN